MKTTLLSLFSFFLLFTAAAQPKLVSDASDLSMPAAEQVSAPAPAQQFYNYNLLSKLRLDSIGGSVPLSYNEYVQNYIDIYTGRKDMFGKMLGLSEYYFPIFEKALKTYDIPEEIKYLPIIESAMDSQAVSKSGATGLWQFMFATAKGYHLNMDNFEDQRKDPVQASYAAAAYFRDVYNVLGDWLLTLAAYNCGQGCVSRAIEKAGSRDFWEIRSFLPVQTQNYVPAFIAAVYTMKYAGQHQIFAGKNSLAVKTDTIRVDRFVSLTDLSAAMHIEEDILLGLNPSYKRKIVNGTQAAAKRIVLPEIAAGYYGAVYDVLNKADAIADKRAY